MFQCKIPRQKLEKQLDDEPHVLCHVSGQFYYYAMYQAMLLNYEVVHKSNFVQTDMLLGGLFLMNMMDESDRVTYKGIEEGFLRLLYERAASFFTKENFGGFLEKDELVRHLHEHTGARFHSYLKKNAFFVEQNNSQLCITDCKVEPGAQLHWKMVKFHSTPIKCRCSTLTKM